MQRELTTGATLVFDTYGPDNAPAVVLLHGLSGSRETYEPVVAHLQAAHGTAIRIVNVDMRGHGDSSHHSLESYEATTYAADIAELSQALNLGPALVAGHSLGGVVAASLAAHHDNRVHSVLLEDPPLFEGDDARRAASPVASFFPMLVGAVRQLQTTDAPLSAFEELAATHSPASEVAERARSLKRWDPTTMEAAIDGTVWRRFNPLNTLSCPMTVLRADPSVGAVFEPRDTEALLATNPNARVHLIAGAGHSIHAGPQLPDYLGHLDAAVRALLADQ
jgi:pimeloyl-ACP methyl ester carboxylesterase